MLARRVAQFGHRGGAARTGGSRPAFLEPFESLLPKKAARAVVVLCDPEQRRLVMRWGSQFTGDRVHLVAPEFAPEWKEGMGSAVFHKAANLSEQARELRRIGPIDVLLDLQPGSVADHERTWRRLFYHLAPRGAYVIALECVEDESPRDTVADWAYRMSRSGRAVPSADGSYVDAVASVGVSRELLIFGKRHRHYLKLRDEETDSVLPAREPGVRITRIATLPPGQLESRARVISHEADVPIPWLPDQMPYPALRLRHYEGDLTLAGNTLGYTQTAILPESFRWHLVENPGNPLVRNVSPSFGRLKAGADAQRELDGHYYLLDPQYKNHFGHFLTESIGRLWGWDQAKQQIPDLKVLYGTRNVDKSHVGFERRLIEAFGVAPRDIVTIDEPVRINSLVSATAMWHNADPHYVHPGLSEVWRRISTNLVPADGPRFDKVFVSRLPRWSRRTCRNVPAVEELFARHGFEIIYPEELDLAEQASIFAGSPVIAGFGGSAMMNLMHARALDVLILLSHESYTARNEHLYSALLGGTVHYFWSPADVRHPEGGWSQEAFDSGWEFDFARNGAELEKLLRSL
jgi:capsular polysaccharide biosynthesis protein